MDYLKKTLALLLVVSIVSLTISCSEDEEVGIPPELPPVETMAMDFSDFNSSNSGGRLETQNNWGVAVTVVAIWNTVLAVNLALPVASFGAAINETPSFDESRGVWVWNYDHRVLGRLYTSELTANITSASVEWEMKISQENGFQDVTWYTGETSFSGNSGSWTLNFDENDPTPYLQIDWEKTGEDVASIKYTNVKAGDDDEGAFIEYGITTAGDFDTFYDIFSAKENTTVDIEWNRDAGDGRIKFPALYGDDDFRCWDTTFEDVDCQ